MFSFWLIWDKIIKKTYIPGGSKNNKNKKVKCKFTNQVQYVSYLAPILNLFVESWTHEINVNFNSSLILYELLFFLILYELLKFIFFLMILRILGTEGLWLKTWVIQLKLELHMAKDRKYSMFYNCLKKVF